MLFRIQSSSVCLRYHFNICSRFSSLSVKPCSPSQIRQHRLICQSLVLGTEESPPQAKWTHPGEHYQWINPKPVSPYAGRRQHWRSYFPGQTHEPLNAELWYLLRFIWRQVLQISRNTTPELTPNLGVFPVSTGILAHFTKLNRNRQTIMSPLNPLWIWKMAFPLHLREWTAHLLSYTFKMKVLSLFAGYIYV